ncbi:MAG: hypothetical protein SGPRY_009037, partial [Prymnesium sp.]
MEVVVLSSDEEQPRSERRRASSEGSGASQPVLIDSDDDETLPKRSTHQSLPHDGPNRKRTSDDALPARSIHSKRSRVDLDLFGTAGACGMCAREHPHPRFIVSACSHAFCRGCISVLVKQKLSEALAHEVRCPACSSQLTLSELQQLSAPTAPPRPLAPPHENKPSLHRTTGSAAATKRLMRELQARSHRILVGGS